MESDIIGDIHGHADKLVALLLVMGYRHTGGAWRHPCRRAIFVGDFIDSGPQGVETVQIVRDMVDKGCAIAVMGNHELNAIAWHTPDLRSPGEYLRLRHRQPWGDKNRAMHQAFLTQIEDKPVLHAEIVSWFMTLPLWLDLPDFRVVHACWHDRFIDWLAPQLIDGCYLSTELLVNATTEPVDPAEKDTPTPSVFKAVEAVLKGIEVPLPLPHHFFDNHKNRRDRVRARWWDADAATYSQMALSGSVSETLPDLPVPANARAVAALDKPTFFGHYWMKGPPAPQNRRAACVDYSAGKGGPLVAYRWDGNPDLSADRFAWAG
jgi:hypothetical protein